MIFAEQLRQLAEANTDRLHVIHWLESVQGLPSRPLLRAFIAPYRAYAAFLCGPSPFMETVTHASSIRRADITWSVPRRCATA